MSIFWTFILVALALFAWASVMFIVPSVAASLFRYRLWEHRDRLVDDIRAGVFADDDLPNRIVFALEGFIENSREITAINLALRRWAAHGYVPADPITLANAPEADQKILQPLIEEVDDALFDKMVFGSVSGWIILAVALIPSIVVSLIRERRGRSTVAQVVAHRIRGGFTPDDLEAHDAAALA